MDNTIYIDLRVLDEGLVVMTRREDEYTGDLHRDGVGSKLLEEWAFGTEANRRPGWISAQWEWEAAMARESEARALVLKAKTTENSTAWKKAAAAADEKTSNWMAVVRAFCEQRLPEKVIGPIVRQLEKAGVAEGQPVVLMPSRTLSQMPIGAAALPDGRLFEDVYPLTYAISDVLHEELLGRDRGEGPCLGAFVVQPDDGKDAALLWTALGGAVGAKRWGNSQVLAGSQATPAETIAAARNAGLFWLGCHGSYNDHVPLESTFGLYKGEEGRLTLMEAVKSLKLDSCRLAVLSACQTAKIDSRNQNDASLGLHTALLLSGAPTVWCTLWSVEAVSTTILLVKALEKFQDGLDTAAALRAARDEVRTMSGTDRDAWLDDAMQAVDESAALTDEVKKAVEAKVKSAKEDKGLGRVYRDPYYWSSIVHYGAVQSGTAGRALPAPAEGLGERP